MSIFKSGIRVRFIGDVEEILSEIPEDEQKSVRNLVLNGPLVVSDVLDGGLVEAKFEDEFIHFIYVSERDLIADK